MPRKNKKSGEEKKLPRNWTAVEAHFKTGAGSHGKKGYSRKKKHKKDEPGGDE